MNITDLDLTIATMIPEGADMFSIGQTLYQWEVGYSTQHDCTIPAVIMMEEGFEYSILRGQKPDRAVDLREFASLVQPIVEQVRKAREESLEEDDSEDNEYRFWQKIEAKYGADVMLLLEGAA